MRKVLRTVGFEFTTIGLGHCRRIPYTMRSDINERIKVYRVLYLAITRAIFVAEWFFMYYILFTTYSQQTSILVKQQKEKDVIWPQYMAKHVATHTS